HHGHPGWVGPAHWSGGWRGLPVVGAGSTVDPVRCPASGLARPGAGAGRSLHARRPGAPAAGLYTSAPLGAGAGGVALRADLEALSGSHVAPAEYVRDNAYVSHTLGSVRAGVTERVNATAYNAFTGSQFT